jgi:hypothetical protein
MPLVEMFRANPFIGLTMCVCLLAIFWCIALLPRLGRGHERFLVGFIGLIAIYQGLRMLKDAGVWKPPGPSSLENAATFIVCTLYLVALVVVQIFGAEHHRTKVRLRLAEANEVRPSAEWHLPLEGAPAVSPNPKTPVEVAGITAQPASQ